MSLLIVCLFLLPIARDNIEYATLALSKLSRSDACNHLMACVKFSLATVGIALWAAMSAANIVVLAASAIVCRLMSWESKKQKRGLARSES